MGISTHVLDVTKGQPAGGVAVWLEAPGLDGGWKVVGRSQTDHDGRSPDLFSANRRLQPGTYRLRFDTAAYFRSQKMTGLYPEITVTFTVSDAGQTFHLPLLLSPFGYTTYRGG